jgi:hypothetical protein
MVKYVDIIITNKKEGIKMKKENNNIEYSALREDLISFYEIDIDNCKMTNIDWVTEMALLMSTDHYKHQILSEITYKQLNEEGIKMKKEEIIVKLHFIEYESEERVLIDEEGMRMEFENRLKELIKTYE